MHSTILQFGPIAIRSYPLMLALAFFFGTIVAVRRATKYGIAAHHMVNFITIILVSSILGSRFLFVLEHGAIFLANPISFFSIWQGGLSYHGGLLFALIGTFWWARRTGVSFARVLDILTPSLAVGYFFVRIGCFLNGCCFGIPTDTGFGMTFPLDSPAGQVFRGARLHPVQLYAAVSGSVIFFLLLALEKKYIFFRQGGAIFLLFLAFSALWRFLEEFLRYHGSDSMVLGWVTEAQAYCLGAFLFSIIILTQVLKKENVGQLPRRH